MQFLNPIVLWALLALILPIIIHLFYFRRFKKVYFSNVNFLRDIKEEKSTRSRLRNLLVLLMRLLALAALILAFAQPFIPDNDASNQGNKSVSLFIDNSFSMNALSQDIKLIEKSKIRAEQIIQAYGEEDLFQILTHDFEGRHQNLLNKEDALGLLSEIQLSPSVQSLSKIISRQKQALGKADNQDQEIYVLSDFQNSILDDIEGGDSLLNINFLPLQSVQENNISIDSCWFESPVQMLNQTNRLVFKIKNHGFEDAENLRLSLNYEDQIKPVGSFKIPARGEIIDTINFTFIRQGWQTAHLNITDFPVQFDDDYYFSFNVEEEIKILALTESRLNKYLDAAIEGMNYFSLNQQSINNIKYSEFVDYQLIILQDLNAISSGLSGELKNYMDNGGNVLIFPSKNASKDSYNQFLARIPANTLQEFDLSERTVGELNTEDFVFNDVFKKVNQSIRLPITKGNFKTSSFPSRGEMPLLQYRDGSTFLAKYSSGKGFAFLCNAPLDEQLSDLASSAEIFVPMLYNIAISKGYGDQISYTIGYDELIEVDNKMSENDIVYKMNGPQEFIPGQFNVGSKLLLDINDQIKEAGIFELNLNDEIHSKFGFNFNRKESDLSYAGADQLADRYSQTAKIWNEVEAADFGQIIDEKTGGKTFWRWCIIGALIFLLLETLILRFWKT